MSNQSTRNVSDWVVYAGIGILLGAVVTGFGFSAYDAELSTTGPLIAIVVGLVLTTAGVLAMLVAVVATGVLLGNQLFADSEDRRARERQGRRE